MENVYLVPLIGPEDTIARLHAAVGTVNDGMFQNVRESIVRRVNKCVAVGGGLYNFITVLANQYNTLLLLFIIDTLT
jgi:hypothetical protein